MDCNVQPADIQVKFSGPIAGWVDGDDLLPDGDGEVETPTVEWGRRSTRSSRSRTGRTWMAENLRHVPEGKTISSDPKDGNGVWYPCNLSKAADPSLTETAGLLYSYPVMLGMTGEMTGTNFDQYEGAQGICPDGWHIPTRDEWLSWRVSAAAACPTRRRPISTRRRAAVRLPRSTRTVSILRAAAISMRRAPRRPRPIWPRSRLPTLRRSAWDISQLDGLQGYIQYGRRSGKRHQEHPVLCRYDNLQQELQSHDNRLPGWLWRCPGSLYQEQGVILTPAHKHTQHKQQ
ncbi:MAG: FISUMP domain-containing protein [Alistipes onderdonkii]